MKLFKIDKDWNLQVEDAVWGLEPFKKILNRDKSKDKKTAIKEVAFVYYYADIKSDYMIIPEDKRTEEIKKGLGLKDTWKKDATIDAAIEFYKERSITPIGEIYLAAVEAVQGVKDYLKKTKTLLHERDSSGKPITKVGDITRALKDVKTIMQDLKAAHKEVLTEQKDNVGKHKGAQEFNTFESGL